MGVARLLAKAWIVFCLFAGAHAIALGLGRGEAPLDAIRSIVICGLLFGAMGLLFIAGLGVSTGLEREPFLARLRPHHLMPDFNDGVFLAFVALSFVNQVFVAPMGWGGVAAIWVHNAMLYAIPGTSTYLVPGHAGLVRLLMGCGMNGGRYFAGSFTWLLAIVYVASSVSRIGLTAGILRLGQTLHPSAFGLTLLAAIYGVVAIVGFQLLFVGSIYPWLDCTTVTDITGDLLIGLAPLMLAYLVFAALATLRASGPEPS